MLAEALQRNTSFRTMSFAAAVQHARYQATMLLELYDTNYSLCLTTLFFLGVLELHTTVLLIL